MGDTRPARSPAWQRDEIILALDVYVRSGALGGGPLPGKTSQDVLDLSDVLQQLPVIAPDRRALNFRNPAGVALKLANFRAVEHDVLLDRGLVDPGERPRGMSSYGQLDRSVFEEFFGNWSQLAAEADAIRAAAPLEYAHLPTEQIVLRDVPVETFDAHTFEASRSEGGTRSRFESALVTRYAIDMRSAGHEVGARQYYRPGETRPLRCDVFVGDLNLLVEAKASDSRASIRCAIGQLFDYRRSHQDAPSIAGLFPHRPRSDLVDLLHHAGADAIWQEGSRFRDTAGGRWVP